jgi:hypothetical protein
MKTGYYAAIIAGLLMVSSACRHTPIPPPPDAIPGQISVVADVESPYWTSMIQTYVPKQLNYCAHFPIAETSGRAPHRLLVRIVSSHSYVAGFDPNQNGGSNVRYRTKVEVRADFRDENNVSVWTWSGWSDHVSAAYAVERCARLIGTEMSKDGLLAPSYYTRNR